MRSHTLSVAGYLMLVSCGARLCACCVYVAVAESRSGILYSLYLFLRKTFCCVQS